MTNQKAMRPPQRDRRRAAETVISTELAVITAHADEPWLPIGFRHEVDVAKASVLYADKVEILSHSSSMINELNRFEGGDGTALYALLYALDDDMLRQLQLDIAPEHIGLLLPMIAELDADAIRAVAAESQIASLDELADIVDQVDNPTNPRMAELRTIADRLRIKTGLAELDPALRKSLVRFNDKVPLGIDAGVAIFSHFLKELEGYLLDPGWFLLLDADVAALVAW